MTWKPFCGGCGDVSPSNARYCMTCGRPLYPSKQSRQRVLSDTLVRQIRADKKGTRGTPDTTHST